MKRFFAFISFFLFSLFIFARPAFAATFQICPPTSNKSFAPFQTLCRLTFEESGSIVNNIVTFLLIIAIIIAVLFLIFGGIKWIISGGDKAAVEGARNTIVAAIIGLVIALLALFIIKFVLGLLGVTSGGTFTFPTLIPGIGD